MVDFIRLGSGCVHDADALTQRRLVFQIQMESRRLDERFALERDVLNKLAAARSRLCGRRRDGPKADRQPAVRRIQHSPAGLRHYRYVDDERQNEDRGTHR